MLSVSVRKWIIAPHHGFSHELFMEKRNVNRKDLFLKPKIKDWLPNPYELHDIEKAALRLKNAIENNEKIVLFGDYDVDGACSVALLYNFLQSIGYTNVLIYIPNRFTEGYGPSVEAIHGFANDGYTLLFTLDCGSTACKEIEWAKSLNIDTIIIDHHVTVDAIANAYAIVNPNKHTHVFDECSCMAAVGVVFMFLIVLKNILAVNIDLLKFVEIVALGTVCDVMPLVKINRALVTYGLNNMGYNIGIQKLKEIAGLNGAIDAYHMGFYLGPRINAGGRLGYQAFGAKLLTTNDADEAISISEVLNDLNNERKTQEGIMLQQAIELLGEHSNGIAVIDRDGWNEGIIGIIASKIKDRTYCPAIVIAWSGDIGKGSCRTIEGFDIGSAVIKAVDMGILEKGGGHKMAAGFSIAKSKLQEFKDFLEEAFKDCTIIRSLNIDFAIDISAINDSLFNMVKACGPFGQGNNAPIFMLSNIVFSYVRQYETSAYCYFKNSRVKAVIYNNALIEAVVNANKPLSVAFRLDSLSHEKIYIEDILI